MGSNAFYGNVLKIESFVEPLLKELSIKDVAESCGQRRADVTVPSSSDKLYVVDVVTVDVCKLSVIKNSFSEVSAFFDSESRDFSKLVSKSAKKEFDITLWGNRLVFTIFQHVPTMIDGSLEAVSV
ncbi:hypothetical protein RCL1_001277 [Eukaryota sp. TZLM3-RCL]